MLRVRASLSGPAYSFRPGQVVAEKRLRELGEDPDRWCEVGLAEWVAETATVSPEETAAVNPVGGGWYQVGDERVRGKRAAFERARERGLI